MADRAVDQGTLRVDALDPEVPRVVGPIADQVADIDMLMLRQLAVRVAPERPLVSRGSRGDEPPRYAACRYPGDLDPALPPSSGPSMTCVTWGDEGERPEN
jgi:hypothetical protein